MANQYDTNLKLQAIADAIGDTSSSGLISALEDIADAVAGGGGGGSSTAGLVSDNFSETDTYDLGDYCIHNNTLYVCINAITTPGPWDLSDWQATNAGLELSSLNSAIAEKADKSAFDNLASKHKSGINWGNTETINLDRNKSYFVCAATNGSTYSMVYLNYDANVWNIFGTNNAGLTISGDTLNIPRYRRYIIITS
jgi:hypothetical protein